jgi:mycothiol synthase
MQIRPLTLDDATEAASVANRYERHWDLPLMTTPAHVTEELSEPGLDLEEDSRGYWLDGSMVAYGLVVHRPSGIAEERAFLDGRVDPDWRGQGIGRDLLGWQIERGRQRLADRNPSLPWYLRAYDFDWVEDSQHLYRRFGMQPVRYFQEMIRPLDEPVPIQVPDGVEVVPWDRSLDEPARQAQNAAFADHWSPVPQSEEVFRHRLESHDSRLDLSFLALADGEVIAVCRNGAFPEDEAVTGRRDAWVHSLGVVRPWRGRGVASTLIAMSFNAFIAEGFTHSMIGVDSENPTGAAGLYKRLGYEPLYQTVAWELSVGQR